jgi:hypothetical protein
VADEVLGARRVAEAAVNLRLFVGVAALAIAILTPLWAARVVLGGIVTLFAPRRGTETGPAAGNVEELPTGAGR